MGKKGKKMKNKDTYIWEEIKDSTWIELSKTYLKKCQPEQAFEKQMEDYQKNYASHIKGVSSLFGELILDELRKAFESTEAKLIFEHGYTIETSAIVKALNTGISDLIKLPLIEIESILLEQKKQTENTTRLLKSFILYNRSLNRTEAIQKLKALSKRSRNQERDEMTRYYDALVLQLEKTSDTNYEDTKRVVFSANNE